MVSLPVDALFVCTSRTRVPSVTEVIRQSLEVSVSVTSDEVSQAVKANAAKNVANNAPIVILFMCRYIRNSFYKASAKIRTFSLLSAILFRFILF